MTRTYVLTALSGFALIGASPALAQHGHQGTGPSPTTTSAPTAPVGTASDTLSNPGVSVRDTARANSQGPANASPTGIENANENSVLSGTSTTTTPTTSTTTKTKESHRPPR